MTAQTDTPHERDTALQTAIAELRQQLPSHAIVADDHTLREMSPVWNGAITSCPRLIVRCSSTADVQAAVVAGRAAALPIAVRGGGHDWAGRAIVDGGVVIDLRPMRHVQIDGNTATIGGGATSSDVLDAALPHGLAAVTGTVGSVGFAGLTLGGGYGKLIGAFGLAVDNLRAAEVVLADGRAVWTGEHDEPDLFWALRGAGGNFGVVTQMQARLHAVAEVTTGVLAFPWAQARSVLHGLRALTATSDDALDVIFGALAGPDGRVLFLSPTWAGAAERVDEVIDQVRRLGDPVLDQVVRTTLAESVHALDADFPFGRNYDLDSRTVPGLSVEAIDALLAAGDTMPDGCALNVHHAHGAATRGGPTDMAFADRDEHLVVEILGAWETGDGTAARDWVRASASVLDPVASPGGWAVFMPVADERIKDAYAMNVERIRSVKERYDPDGIFNATPLPGGR